MLNWNQVENHLGHLELRLRMFVQWLEHGLHGSSTNCQFFCLFSSYHHSMSALWSTLNSRILELCEHYACLRPSFWEICNCMQRCIYHLVFLDLESTEVYYRSISNNSDTFWLLHHLHLHRCRVPVTLQWFYSGRPYHWVWTVCSQIVYQPTDRQHQLKPSQSVNILWCK